MDKNLMILVPIALVGGTIGLKLKIPAGGIIFSLITVAGVKLLMELETGYMPDFLTVIPQAVLGLVLGTQFSNRVPEYLK